MIFQEVAGSITNLVDFRWGSGGWEEGGKGEGGGGGGKQVCARVDLEGSEKLSLTLPCPARGLSVGSNPGSSDLNCDTLTP